MNDFLGNEIQIGMRALRATPNTNWKIFQFCTVQMFGVDSYGKPTVEILTDGNTKTGFTYPDRLIVETAFKQSI